MNKKYLSLGLAVAVLLALFGMALQDPLRFPVINRAVTAVITPFAAAILRRQQTPSADLWMTPAKP